MSTGDQKRIEIRDRDVALLRTLFECRVMTRSHAATLHFDGKTEAAKKRVQSLKAAGYVKDRPRLPHEPAVLMLTRKGFELLQSRGSLDEFSLGKSWKQTLRRLSVSPLTIGHELEVMDFRAAIVAAIRRNSRLAIAEFFTWPAMLAYETRDEDGHVVEIRPDGFFRLIHQDDNDLQHEYSFFIEVDRSTESQSILIERIRCYRQYYRHGGLALRYGKAPHDYKSFPFRVLVTCRSAERRNNLAEGLSVSDKRVGGLVWITTMIEALNDPLGAIWITTAKNDNTTEGRSIIG